MKTLIKTLTKKIDEENAPTRLKGLEIQIEISEADGQGKLDFRANMPENPTGNEIGYIKLLIGDLVDDLEQKIPGLNLNKKYEGILEQ